MVSHRQKALLLNAEAVSRSERLPDCFFCVEAVAVHGLDALLREQRADGELLLRFDAARRRSPDAAPQVVKKSAATLAQALPLHLLACACLREPGSGAGWAHEHAPSNMTTGACMLLPARRRRALTRRALEQGARWSTCGLAWTCCCTCWSWRLRASTRALTKCCCGAPHEPLRCAASAAR